MILALTLAAAPLTARVDAVATHAKLAGVVLVAKGEDIVVERGFGPVAPEGGVPHRADARWRLASITKQVVAAQVLASTAAQPDLLDSPIPRKRERALAGLTVRQLLTHRTGLANLDDTPPGPGGVPSAYLQPKPDLRYCASRPATPGAPFAYNNCDYLWADGWRGGKAWPAGMAMARAGEMGVPGFIKGRPEPAINLASFGAAGGLMGTPRAVLAFDRALMTGTLLPEAARAQLWNGDPEQGYQAIGQWVFPGRLKGCAKPKRIVQRDGEIGGVQARNFILPDDDLVVIVFTNRSSDDFQFGEIWQGKGFAYDLLSAAACP